MTSERTNWMRVLVLLLVFCGRATDLDGQVVPAFAELPDTVAERLISFYNSPGTIRLSGESYVAAGTEIGGPVAVLGGPLTVAGAILGDLAVINGNLRLEPGATISGSVTVVGGTVQGEDVARVERAIAQYREPLRFRHQDGDLVHVRPVEAELSAGREFGFGRTDILLAVRGAYNRVEGLPISLGPRVRLGRSNPTMLEGLLIYRSSAGLRLDPDQLGYAINAGQYVGGRRTARIGLRLFSEVSPVEQWGLTDRENSLATFLLHRDYRDAYERAGWAGYVHFGGPSSAQEFTIEYRDERHRRVAPASPWSLFDNEEEWRPEPAIAEGTLRTVITRLTYDTRNDGADPSSGWHILTEVEQGLGGRLAQRVAFDVSRPGDTPLFDPGSRERFTAALFDVRRYQRISPDTRVALRLVAAGSVDGTALPPQRQQTLGGEGSLPGYSLFAFDCGARSVEVDVDGVRFFPFYGCDRLALAQLEVESAFPFARNLGRSVGIDLGQMMRWVIFFDAGRAWTEPGARNGRLSGENSVAADGGFGLRVGKIGAYWAVPLSRRGQGINFFVRIGRRI
jgi:hypothetical protein